MESIGDALRTEREKRGLSLEDAHENTKITVQNITALEEDRFDSFPNKVYARAFLRDYANYLGLDSAELLTEYEDKWSPKAMPENAQVRKSGGFWRVVGYTLLVLIIAAGLGAGGYFGWQKLKHERRVERTQNRVTDSQTTKPDTAVIPKAPPVEPPKPEVSNTEAAKPPVAAPKPPAPAAPQTLTLEVTALLPVWTQIDVDGKTALVRILAKGQKMTFTGEKSIYIKTGMAGAVQLKLNGQPQPPLGSLKVRGQKTFTLPATPAAAPSAPAPSAPAAPAPSH